MSGVRLLCLMLPRCPQSHGADHIQGLLPTQMERKSRPRSWLGSRNQEWNVPSSGIAEHLQLDEGWSGYLEGHERERGQDGRLMNDEDKLHPALAKRFPHVIHEESTTIPIYYRYLTSVKQLEPASSQHTHHDGEKGDNRVRQCDVYASVVRICGCCGEQRNREDRAEDLVYNLGP